MSDNTLKRKAVRVTGQHTASRHWIYQRLSAVALLPLTVWLVLLLDSALHQPYQQTLDWLTNPVNNLAILAWLLAVCYHAAAGMQVVFEDYVANPVLRKRLVAVTWLFFLGMALVAGGAVISVIFSGN